MNEASHEAIQAATEIFDTCLRNDPEGLFTDRTRAALIIDRTIAEVVANVLSAFPVPPTTTGDSCPCCGRQDKECECSPRLRVHLKRGLASKAVRGGLTSPSGRSRSNP